MKTKAVVYGRVSKDDDSQDYGRQLYELQEYAKRNDIEIVQEFTERISGTKEQRKQLNLMLDYVYKSGIKNILVTELSRFGRLGHKTRSIFFVQLKSDTCTKPSIPSSSSMNKPKFVRLRTTPL